MKDIITETTIMEDHAHMPFLEFPKMARLSREAIVTEKIDGTNAQIYISSLDDGYRLPDYALSTFYIAGWPYYMAAGSRTRWITPEDDNYGFARWVFDHAEMLKDLGVGRHFGEWWGQGIQRKYGMKEKRWSLFNVIRWCLHDQEPGVINTANPTQPKMQDRLPACCHLVPVLARGIFTTDLVEGALEDLRANGSKASPGFSKPEGVVVFHTAGNVGFKKTLDKDEQPKSLLGQA